MWYILATMRQHRSFIQHTFALTDNAFPTAFRFDLFYATPRRYPLSLEDSSGLCRKKLAPRLEFIGSELPAPINNTKISAFMYSILPHLKHLSGYQ
jgi:hypothetical protein